MSKRQGPPKITRVSREEMDARQRQDSKLNIIPLDKKPKRERLDEDMIMELPEPTSPQPGTSAVEVVKEVTKTVVAVERTSTQTTITVKGKRFKMEVQKRDNEIKIVL